MATILSTDCDILKTMYRTYNVTFSCVRKTIVAVEKLKE